MTKPTRGAKAKPSARSTRGIVKAKRPTRSILTNVKGKPPSRSRAIVASSRKNLERFLDGYPSASDRLLNNLEMFLLAYGDHAWLVQTIKNRSNDVANAADAAHLEVLRQWQRQANQFLTAVRSLPDHIDAETKRTVDQALTNDATITRQRILRLLSFPQPKLKKRGPDLT